MLEERLERNGKGWLLEKDKGQLYGVRKRFARNKYHRKDRTAERNALSRLEEPPPKSPRTVDWDLA